MNNRIKIGDFVKLTGSTLKTVLYYHQIGLLQEPERSSNGYRLYGSAELARMQLIKHLKSLGLDLPRIRETLGNTEDGKSLREVLYSLREELQAEKASLEERLEKIEQLLTGEHISLEEEASSSDSFKKITYLLGPEKIDHYAHSCPELYTQHKKIYGILDHFKWGADYQGTIQSLAIFFDTHPKEYEMSIQLGARLSKLAQLHEDDPEVESLARDSADFIKSVPLLKEMLCTKRQGVQEPFVNVYQDLISEVRSPAQTRHGQLMYEFLSKI